MARDAQIAVAMHPEEKARIEATAKRHSISPSRLLYLVLAAATNNFSFFAIDFRASEQISPDDEQTPSPEYGYGNGKVA